MSQTIASPRHKRVFLLKGLQDTGNMRITAQANSMFMVSWIYSDNPSRKIRCYGIKKLDGGLRQDNSNAFRNHNVVAALGRYAPNRGAITNVVVGVSTRGRNTDRHASLSPSSVILHRNPLLLLSKLYDTTGTFALHLWCVA